MRRKLLIALLAISATALGLTGLIACSTDGEHKHNLTHAEAIEATCIDDGYAEYWYCPDCGKYFADENATEEFTPTAQKGQHNYVDYICTVCDSVDPAIPCSEGLDFELADGGEGYIFSGVGTCQDEKIVIPDTVNGKPVVQIGLYTEVEQPTARAATDDLSNAQVIQNGVKEVIIPNSVKIIGAQAFYSCTTLESVHLGIGVTTICEYAFGMCTSLAKVNFPLTLKTIERFAFFYTALTDVRLPNSVSHLGMATFYLCGELKSIKLSENIPELGDFAFASCASLTGIVIPDSVKTIGFEAFVGCDALQTVKFGNGLVEIGDEAFTAPFTSLEIPDSVTTIGDFAFASCTNLKTVSFGKGLEFLGKEVFQRDRAIESITVANGNKTYHNDGNCFIETATKTILFGFKNSVIPSDGSVTAIANGAFFNAPENLVIPSSVTKIGGFGSCDNIKSLTVNSNHCDIGAYAFGGCSALQTLTLNGTDINIGAYAFNNCTALENITVNGNIAYIGYSAFSDTAFYKDESNWENEYFYLDKILIAVKSTAEGALELKEGTLGIGEHVFKRGIDSVKIPNSLIFIGDNAFDESIYSLHIYFDGNKDEWDAIQKGENWKPRNYYTLHCADGNEYDENGNLILPPECS